MQHSRERNEPSTVAKRKLQPKCFGTIYIVPFFPARDPDSGYANVEDGTQEGIQDGLIGREGGRVDVERGRYGDQGAD